MFKKFNELKNNLGNIGENKLLLITAVKVMDEYHETKKKVDQKKIELKNIGKNNICRHCFNSKTISKVYGCTKRRICENDSWKG